MARRSHRGVLTVAEENIIAQFIAGTSHEMEHTDKWYEAGSTALDHLREDRRYYSKMKRAFPEEGERDLAAVHLVDRHMRLNPDESPPPRPRCRCGELVMCYRCRGTGYCGPHGDCCDRCEGHGQYGAYCRVHEDQDEQD